MGSGATSVILASVDAADRLLTAEEPFAGFHRRCGGELPGPIVTPALLELVRKARQYGLKLARAIRAQDEHEAVTMWVEVEPLRDGAEGPDGGGCAIVISSWRSEPVHDERADAASERRLALARHQAGLSARLGPQQELLAVFGETEELGPLAAEMRAGIGRAWTEFVTLAGEAGRQSQPQAMHWRLLDGARVRLAGSARGWSAGLFPIGRGEGGQGESGFELHLLPDTALPEAAPSPPTSAAARGSGIGLEIAPVLRQPVARIIANAETIRTQLAGPLAEGYSTYAADIAAAGEHLLALIDDLTTLEMVDAAGFAPAPDRIDLGDLARRAAGILGMRARERGIVIEAPAPDTATPAIGEFRRVLQILLNLVENALRYSPRGAQVWIRCESRDGWARVIVADEGEGLDAREQARAFEKFERLGRSDEGGSGLGLYISRRLAHAMGGTLTVDSSKGLGARFTLTLPADDELAGEGRGDR